MTLEQTPWMIGGGAVHSAAIARQVSYAATNGNRGVVALNDMKVRAQTTPGSSVLAGPGSAVVLGTYPGQTGQSYVSRNVGDEAVAIPATAASARADLIILTIDDPEYSGATPANPQNYAYAKFERVANVAASATSAPSSVTKPHIVLARVNVPANTGAVTNAMITDLRRVANPRTKRVVKAVSGPAVAEVLTQTAGSGETWPDNANWLVEVPEWANRVKAIGHWAGVDAPGVGGGANFDATVSVNIGTLQVAATFLDRPATADRARLATTAGEDTAIPALMRGSTETVAFRGVLRGTSSAAARPKVDAASRFVIDLEFTEEL